MIEKIENLLLQWLDRLTHKDLEGILSVYKKDPTLMSTLSNKIHKTPPERRDYFKFFLTSLTYVEKL